MRSTPLFAFILLVFAGCASPGSSTDGGDASTVDGARIDGSAHDGSSGGDGAMMDGASGDGSSGDGSTDAGPMIDFGDSLPVLAIGDVRVTESNAGVVDAVFTVTLAGTYAGPIAVHFATMDDTATTADGDYATQSGMLMFGPTDTSQTITVAVNGDTTPEVDESFTVMLDGATNAHLLVDTGTGTIVDDDCTYVLSASSHSFATTTADTSTVTVTTNAPICAWTAVRDDSILPSPWLTITSGSSYAGTADVSFAVTANSGRPRSGMLTIAGSTFLVTQAGACMYSISPTTLTFDTFAPTSAPTSVCVMHTEMAMVTATAGCRWSAVVDPGADPAGWLTITTGAGPSTGTGATQIVTYRVQANAHNATPRSGTMTIVDSVTGATSAILTVDQVADPTHACP